MLPRDGIAKVRKHVAHLEAELSHADERERATRAHVRDAWASRAARLRYELAIAREALRLVRLRAVHSRLEQIRQPRLTAREPVQVPLLDVLHPNAVRCQRCGGRWSSVRWLPKPRAFLCESCLVRCGPTVPKVGQVRVNLRTRAPSARVAAADREELTHGPDEYHLEPDGFRVVLLPRPTCPAETRPHLVAARGAA
ncbi:hypothetical protein [Myxococcus sp. RHSTA-1-4]|uniref:hypothetical protein n=1 Tax=Myxococcus sp. RHSTA-1-4 TaxID=2874601 RepID=UPI001CBF576A|nr:hypothetical protein [Myxococcus sp. RHSTA-1-4]MBZ4422012.1 hypothetical protein [Myxococcus sp. RHSTA-1-4]